MKQLITDIKLTAHFQRKNLIDILIDRYIDTKFERKRDLLVGSTELSCEEKQTILDEHNRLRQLVALGQVSGQPSAANMREMIWDDELATMAQKWTNRCAEIHDDHRHIRK
ncbi:Venom allergen 5 [Melipona quadrifasciata]|uniref:Venom allergen 5 n=1 Tax=Melipona quadrifasciata TaxID=166423 RepID=A0A0M8ZQ19_9HYME|nr:Venom allergen 5 [Melipona quadrifasciata]